MYPLSVWILIVGVDILIFCYGLTSLGLEYYRKEMALAASTFLSFYLGIAAITGTVVSDPLLVNAVTTTTNTTSNITGNITLELTANAINIYQQVPVMQDNGIMWILFIAGFGQAIIAGIACVEAYEEYTTGKVRRRELT